MRLMHVHAARLTHYIRGLAESQALPDQPPFPRRLSVAANVPMEWKSHSNVNQAWEQFVATKFSARRFESAQQNSKCAKHEDILMQIKQEFCTIVLRNFSNVG